MQEKIYHFITNIYCNKKILLIRGKILDLLTFECQYQSYVCYNQPM